MEWIYFFFGPHGMHLEKRGNFRQGGVAPGFTPPAHGRCWLNAARPFKAVLRIRRCPKPVLSAALRPRCTSAIDKPRTPAPQGPAGGTDRLYCALRAHEEGSVCLAASVCPLQATLVIWYNQYQKQTQLDELRRLVKVSAPEDTK